MFKLAIGVAIAPGISAGLTWGIGLADGIKGIEVNGGIVDWDCGRIAECGLPVGVAGNKIGCGTVAAFCSE